MNKLSVREITTTDIDLLIAYWISADETFLNGMGADITKMLSGDE